MVNLDKFIEEDKRRQESIRRLEKYKRLLLVTKEEVIDKFGGDYVPTRYGFMRTDISEEDFEKVLDIESKMQNCMLTVVAQTSLRGLQEQKELSEDVKERALKLRLDLEYDYQEISELTKPFVEKGLYIPKINIMGMYHMTLAQLCIDGVFDHTFMMVADAKEHLNYDKFGLAVM